MEYDKEADEYICPNKKSLAILTQPKTAMSQAEKYINVKAVRVVLTETNVTLQNMTDESVFHTS